VLLSRSSREYGRSELRWASAISPHISAMRRQDAKISMLGKQPDKPAAYVLSRGRFFRMDRQQLQTYWLEGCVHARILCGTSSDNGGSVITVRRKCSFHYRLWNCPVSA
jgi:hypothetical protein